jgi:hypothetical protein
MIGCPEIDLGVNAGSLRRIKEVGGQREWIPVLLRNPIQGPVINTKAEGTIFLFYEQDRSSMGGTGGANKSYGDVFIDELAECLEFKFGEGVDGSERWLLTFLKVNLEIIRTMFR